MKKLLQELVKGGEITVSPWRVSAKGGVAVTFLFVLALVALVA